MLTRAAYTLATLAGAAGATGAGAGCADGVAIGATLEGQTVCERLDGTGALVFVGSGGAVARRVAKRFVPMYVDESKSFLGFNKTQLGMRGADVLGNALLARAKGDPTWAQVASAVPPMRYDGGFDYKDPAHGGRAAQGGAHTFVGSRASSVYAAFDTLGSSVGMVGTPDMNQWPGKYGRSTAVFKQPIDKPKTMEGLFGGWLPIVSFRYAEAKGGGEIEWTAVPVEDATGSIELAVFFRVLRIANGTVVESKFYETFAYTASGGVPAKGQPAGSKTAKRFYSAVAAQQDYWEGTMAREGVMIVDLPESEGTDGKMLANQSLHSIARDMISRIGAVNMNGTGIGFFPQYGVSGVYAKAANHGFEDTFQASFTMALEWGCFEYAKGLLHNWLSYYLIPDIDDEGFSFTGINYRGPEMPMHGRQLTTFALYHSYTGDPDGLLLQHFDRIQGLVAVLRRIRAKALTLPTDHPAHGMPAGNDEADLGGSSIECGECSSSLSSPFRVQKQLLMHRHDLRRQPR